MSYRCFDVSVDDQVAHIVMNRPEKRNSMIPEFWDELPAIVDELDGGALVRAIVISSTGPHFSAGLDLQSFDPGQNLGGITGEEEQAARRRHGAHFYQMVRHMQNTFSCLEQSRIPVLAAIQGGCIGGGVDLVTACDMRYATEDAYLTIFEINVGMTADVGTFPRIVKLLPEGVVRELAYTGRRMSAQEARELGLVNRVFADQESMVAGVLEIAREIASKPPLAVYGCKRMINYARDHSTADGLDYIGIWNASMLQPEEMAEAVTARAQKREGKFVDLPKLTRKLTRD